MRYVINWLIGTAPCAAARKEGVLAAATGVAAVRRLAEVAAAGRDAAAGAGRVTGVVLAALVTARAVGVDPTARAATVTGAECGLGEGRVDSAPRFDLWAGRVGPPVTL
jgi:hypothetical protein